MPRVETRKAAKDYPEQGIKKGDTYYYAKIRVGRGGIELRSTIPFRPSQLTRAPFRGGWLTMQEAWQGSDQDADAIREAAEAIRELGNDAQGSFDNMPEGLQQGETGQKLENRASECERIADELDELAERWDGLDDVEEVDEPDEDLLKNDGTDEVEYEQAVMAWEAYQDALATREAEESEIKEEAENLIGDMPE